MSEFDFDPDDMSELEGIFAEMISDNEDGFLLEFGISRLSAKELVDLWYQSVNGSKQAQLASWAEYTKIIIQLKEALSEDD